MYELKRRQIEAQLRVKRALTFLRKTFAHGAILHQLTRAVTGTFVVAITLAGHPCAPGLTIHTGMAAETAARPAAVGGDQSLARPPVRVTAAALELHRAALLIDGHNDLPWELRQHGVPPWSNFDIATLHKAVQTDIPRLRTGGVGAQFWSVWVPPRTAHEGTALKTTLAQINLVNAMIERYPRVFEHIAKVAGIDHVGIGSDFDGAGGILPAQLEDVACFVNITQELIDRGYDAVQIKKILGGNLLRVLRQAEAVALRRQAD